MSVYFLGKSRKPQSFKTTEQKKKSVKNCCALEKFGKLFCSIENAMDSESTFCDCCELRKGCIIWSVFIIIANFLAEILLLIYQKDIFYKYILHILFACGIVILIHVCFIYGAIKVSWKIFEVFLYKYIYYFQYRPGFLIPAMVYNIIVIILLIMSMLMSSTSFISTFVGVGNSILQLCLIDINIFFEAICTYVFMCYKELRLQIIDARALEKEAGRSDGRCELGSN